MDKLPIEILEKILTYENITLADVTNVLRSSKYLRRTIPESNFIWKHVFTQRWPDLLSMENSKEVTNWFDEVRHIITLLPHVIDICANMASCFKLVNNLLPRDFSELNNLVANRKFNDIYIGKHLSFLRRNECYINSKCYINSISAVPSSTMGNLTLRYYADQAYHHLHQTICIKELTEFLRIPEEFLTFERCVAIISRLLHPFEDIKYEDIKKELNKLGVKAQDVLREVNPYHPLFAIAQDIQSSWKDQTLDANIFEKNHILEVLNAVNKLFLKMNYSDSMQKDRQNYHDDDYSYINKVLCTGTGEAVMPVLLSLIYDSICRRLGVHCELILSSGHFISYNLKIVCPAFGAFDYEAFYIHLTGYRRLREIPVIQNRSASTVTPHEVISCTFDNLEAYFSAPRNKSMLKLIGRLKIVLDPEQRNNQIL